MSGSNFYAGLILLEIILTIVGCFSFIIFSIIKENRNIKKTKIWRESIKIGDKVSIENENENAEIVDLSDDVVTIKIKISKEHIYKPK